MSEEHSNNKKNKELDPNNKERNLKEYNSNDTISSQNGQNPSQKQDRQQHVHDDSCSCGQ
ncbi:MAG: hypothetical protein ABJB76_08025 [Candidatus Nitrosocosmicus sp.]